MAAVLIIAAFLIILVIIFELFSKITRSSRKGSLNLPPGSYGWPVLGETAEFLGAGLDGTPEKFVRERMEKYKSQVFKTSIMGEPMAVLCGAAGNKFLFSNENKLVMVWWPSSVRRLLGPCLATSGGDEGRQMRRMVLYFVSPDAFTRLYIKTMDMVSQKHINTHWQGNEEVKVFPTIKSYTFELACRLFMSLEDEEQIRKLATLFNIFLKGIISIPINLPGSRFYKAKKATSAIKNQLHKLVRERRGGLEQKAAAVPAQDLLSHLLVTPDENGKLMAESVIVNNILMLLFAGHDTSSVTITMLLKSLAEHPDVYEKVLKEQKEIASTRKGEFLQWEDIQKMRYSWSVVCEVTRLWPPVSGAFREALTDISYGGYDIPKGWKLYWSSTYTHKDSSFFTNYAKFDPSRFEEATGPAPFSYVPFGGGPRMCLGKEFARLEVLVFLHNLITRFRWNLVNPNEKIAYDPMPTPVAGLPILLQPHI